MTIEPASAPIERVRFSTDQEDEAEDFIGRMFVGNRMRFLGRASVARFQSESAIGPVICADRVRSTVDYRAETDPFDYFVFLSVGSGRLHVTGDRSEAFVQAGQHCVLPTGVALDLRIHAIDVAGLRVPAELLRTAATDHGLEDRPVRFDSLSPVSTSMARYWSAVMGLAHNTLLTDDAVAGHPLLVAEITHTVGIAALHTFPSSIMTRQAEPASGRVEASALRRAIAFIEENAHRPITLSDVAGAAGISARGLQFAFARHRDTTPMQHLRLVRLSGAHRDLQFADPQRGATVEQIARRWGFASPSRFAHYYRDAYGVPPHQTLNA
jgi:AraC-like DNA-binding protein